MGRYGGWSFKSDLGTMFVHAYKRLWDVRGSFRPSIVVLDLTHSVNYQLLAVAIAARAVFREKVLVYNSEPYPPEARPGTCIETRGPMQTSSEPPSLEILDASELWSTLELLEALEATKLLEVGGIAGWVRRHEGLKHEMWREVVGLLEELDTVLHLLRVGLPALVYSGSNITPNIATVVEDAEKLAEILEKEIEKVDKPPKIDLEKRQIVYDRVSPLAILAHTLRKTIVEPLADAKEAKSLEEYLDRVEEMYRRANLEANTHLTRRLKTELARTTEQICRQKSPGTHRIDSETYRRAWQQTSHIKPEQGGEERSVGLETLVAHAGFSHRIVDSIEIECGQKPRVKRIFYNPTKTKTTLQHLNSRLTGRLKFDDQTSSI